MNICGIYKLEIKKMSNICVFDRILKIECNLQHFTSNCRIKNFNYFERIEADAFCQEQDF